MYHEGGEIVAEFVQTMKNWRRMCNFMEEKYGNDSCDKCPLKGCSAIYEDDGELDYPDIEKKVSAWAAEHPEPVYPRWIDWLADVGLIINTADHYAFNFTAAADHIPADIAEKLGIEPKESV